ncbi:MAG TPA: TylF/MycF/NovP-related O-methyltransferase [Solirubrobacteraceae bacterium]|nr:TylF/MycF/NovP-related O-methyltransferase [Solirubrobacteraceae bacterium]
MPLLIAFLGDSALGREYGAGFWTKLKLCLQFKRNIGRVETLSSIREHIELARALLSVPASVPGDVVECGCYVGGSSVNISLVCELVGRRLVICDSFEGLPEPSDYDREHLNLHSGSTDEYYKGRFAASLDTVKANIGRCGSIEACDFVVGFFEDTLPQLDRPVVMGFLDMDLIDSLKPCLTGIWPNLADGCRVYVHEANSLSLVSLFFDAAWWREQLGEDPPGFVGTGTGLPLTAVQGSWIGYAQKGARLITPATLPGAATR